jgi:hypothetical protein
MMTYLNSLQDKLRYPTESHWTRIDQYLHCYLPLLPYAGHIGAFRRNPFIMPEPLAKKTVSDDESDTDSVMTNTFAPIPDLPPFEEAIKYTPTLWARSRLEENKERLRRLAKRHRGIREGLGLIMKEGGLSNRGGRMQILRLATI